ncbi:DHH family phosphoesterase [Mesoterricola silvestris]|uniref:Phosphodiesterase n=1 Tax=Mesoterricola silvestris TaxID=2927979 RepID=A0AA48K9R2_9BACT|nr:bifunctional oligoribonuclease/PAP phosphatase NrnA [Mesoterricola silvestris]BDU73776.1 phosphodiesterase [Mesoterricola silvestris]
MLNRFNAFLENQDRILLTTHENPDGDGIGAMVGLAHYLKARGKEVRIVVHPRLPDFLAFLDPGGWVEALDLDGRHRDLAAWPSTWIIVDASEPHRLGPLLPAFQATPAVTACLDHHLKDAPAGFREEFTDPTASASAELVYELAVAHMPLPLPAPMADALYAGVVEDTGNFRFSNATAKVHRMAAQLIEQGVAPARIYQNLYHQGRLEKLRLTGRAFDKLVLQGQGRYARISLTQADLDACGANHDDMETLVNRPLELKGVEVSCLLYELADGRVKASLRSREQANVNQVCRRFGGGGHRLASGAKLDGPLSKAQNEMDAAVLAQLEADFA